MRKKPSSFHQRFISITWHRFHPQKTNEDHGQPQSSQHDCNMYMKKIQTCTTNIHEYKPQSKQTQDLQFSYLQLLKTLFIKVLKDPVAGARTRFGRRPTACWTASCDVNCCQTTIPRMQTKDNKGPCSMCSIMFYHFLTCLARTKASN